ncbi:hypothetical protein HPB48_019610 [Haemaphysalis longicornis]|uniref:SKA complex subunit 1 n=1 Tax=Haemaphysalis longicornis TaxID=44386 RepID=A0A9J6FF93_HAELO|nr:hypothetical protein HPB48_019610 [Haemaphysalis longicornis]
MGARTSSLHALSGARLAPGNERRSFRNCWRYPRPHLHQRVKPHSKMTSEEYIAHLNRRLDELDLSIKIAELGPEDAHYLKKAQEKLREAVQTKREIDELIQRYEQLKAEKAALVAALEMRLRLAELQKAFLDGLPQSAPGDAAAGADNNGPADLTTADKKGPQQDIKHISPLTEEEFASAKKCARSRFTLAGLNELVVAFNAALDAKYALLELPKSHLTGSQRKKMSPYCQQETSETKGLRFYTVSPLPKPASAQLLLNYDGENIHLFPLAAMISLLVLPDRHKSENGALLFSNLNVYLQRYI